MAGPATQGRSSFPIDSGGRASQSHSQRRRHALQALREGIRAVAPRSVTRTHLARVLAAADVRPPAVRRVLVVGGGKAALGMLAGAREAIVEVLGPDVSVGGVVIAPSSSLSSRSSDGTFEDLPIRVAAGDHPLPTDDGPAAAREALDRVEHAGADDLVVVLLSGGASALLAVPVDGVTVGELRSVFALLLGSGAAIGEVNCVRKHLSRTGGGRLGLAAGPARTVVLVMSDVVGDDLGVIGSGPAYGDETTYADALCVLGRYGLRSRMPTAAVAHLERGAAGEVAENPRPGDVRLRHVRHVVVARNLDACVAMAECCRGIGYETLVLSHTLEGEARELGIVQAGLAESVLRDGVPLKAPCALITGGEATVAVRGQGAGGRNQETALAAVARLAGRPVTFLSGGTDGVDGTTEAAGGVVDGASLAAATASGVDIEDALRRNDSGPALERMGCRVMTGPTGTNVADVRLLLVGNPEG